MQKRDSKIIFKKNLSEHLDIFHKIDSDKNLQNLISKSCEVIIQALKKNNQILFCGNGGSAADSQHLAAEFVSRFKLERKALNAEALTVNTSSLTAIGNDYNYLTIFSRQVEAKGKKGDILVGISTSGKSKNIIQALESGKKAGLTTIGFTGSKPSKPFVEQSDICLKIPSNETGRIQESHIFIGHCICHYVEEYLFSSDKT